MNKSKIFILIHGAWHAAWCWEEITKTLRAKGHKILAPDLPGHSQFSTPKLAIQFSDYIYKLTELIKQQEDQVILVGHSMAGLIISYLAEILPSYIRELVFLSGYVTTTPQSLFSIAEQSLSKNLTPFLIIDETLQAISLRKSPDLLDIFFNRCNPQIAYSLLTKLQTQPLQPFLEKIIVGDSFNRVAKRALLCKYDRVLLLSDQLRMAKKVTDNITYIDADHAAYSSGAAQIITALS